MTAQWIERDLVLRLPVGRRQYTIRAHTPTQFGAGLSFVAHWESRRDERNYEPVGGFHTTIDEAKAACERHALNRARAASRAAQGER